MGRNFLDLFYIKNYINKNKNKDGRFEIIAKKQTKEDLYEGLEKYRELKEGEALTDKFLKYIVNFNATRVILKGDTKINTSLIGKKVYLYTGALLERKKIDETMVGFRLCEFENKKKLRRKKKELDMQAKKEGKAGEIVQKIKDLELTEKEKNEIMEKKIKDNEQRQSKMERVKYRIVKKKKQRRYR